MIFKKKKIEEGRNLVYPCVKCGELPVWGSGFLLCPNNCYETLYNRPNGSSVREWNKKMVGWWKDRK